MVRITLRATSNATQQQLYTISVQPDGSWSYESRAIKRSEGRLSPAEFTQFQRLYEQVEWEKELLNSPMSYDDRLRFELEVATEGGAPRLYQFNEIMTTRSWQFRDLVHFLRHNLATGGDPVGLFVSYDQPGDQPTAPQ